MRQVFIILLVIGSLTLTAQELTWHTDVNKAVNIAKLESKPIMMFFTGSDWCGWCIRLQNEVFKKPEFVEWAHKNVILVELDFPRKTQLAAELKQQNSQMQQIFQVRGYPTIWFVTPELKENNINLRQIGKVGYVPGGPLKWLEAVHQFLKK
jgi:protein disulfide-isomerase